MKTPSIQLLAVTALVGASAGANALPLDDRASIEFFAGGEPMSGAFGAFRDNLAGTAGSIHPDRVPFDDAYHHRLSTGAELDYALDSHASAFARFGYSRLDGTNRDIGYRLNADASTTPIAARFGDAATRELTLGGRYAFGTSDTLRPFVGASLGGARLSPLRATVADPDGGNTKVELGREDTVFTQRLETGVQYSPLPNLGLRLTVAADHMDGQRGSDDPNLGLLGLTATHDLRAHWDYPAELGAVWKF